MSRFSENPRVRTAVYLGQNPITMAGVILTTSAAVTLLAFWAYLIARARPRRIPTPASSSSSSCPPSSCWA